jgi:UPF0042 nucleotide-binding protein
MAFPEWHRNHLYPNPGVESDQPTIMSFSYKIGAPGGKLSNDRSLAVFDLRQRVRNPWGESTLRKLNGTNPAVQEFIRVCKKSMNTINYIMEFGNDAVDIAIGCSGGQHRSVAAAVMVFEWVQLNYPQYNYKLVHRDLPK